MMVAPFNWNPSTTIISCFCPTSVSEETDLIAFYIELSFLVCVCVCVCFVYVCVCCNPKHKNFVIVGYMDTQIGKNVNH